MRGGGNDDINDGNFPIGSTLTVSSKDNEELDAKLACTQYTVVGIVHNTNYFSFEREPASVGNGAVELVMYLQPEDFAYDTYTEIYVTAEGALQQNSMEDEYEATVEAVQANVEAIRMRAARRGTMRSVPTPRKRLTTPGQNTMMPRRRPSRSWRMRPRNWRTGGRSWRTARRNIRTANSSMPTASGKWPTTRPR